MGLLMAQGAASVESKFLSLVNSAFTALLSYRQLRRIPSLIAKKKHAKNCIRPSMKGHPRKPSICLE